MRKFIFAAFVVFSLILPRQAQALSCGNTTLWGQFRSHDFVFRGELKSVGENPDFQVRGIRTEKYIFNVIEVYKGASRKTVRIIDKRSSMYSSPLIKGERYLISSTADKTLHICSIPKRLNEKMDDDLIKFILHHRLKATEQDGAFMRFVNGGKVGVIEKLAKETQREWSYANQYLLAFYMSRKDFKNAQAVIDGYRESFKNRKGVKVQGQGNRLFYDIRFDPAVEEAQGRIYFEAGEMQKALEHFSLLAESARRGHSGEPLFRAWRVSLLLKMNRAEEIPRNDNYYENYIKLEPQKAAEMAEDIIIRYSELNKVYPLNPDKEPSGFVP